MIDIALFIVIVMLGAAATRYFFGTGTRQQRRTEVEASRQAATDLEVKRLLIKERAEARALYERLVREKLEVIRDAVAMGYAETDLHRLDKRLAELIGEQQLKQLLSEDPDLPQATDDLRDTDLLNEVDRLKGRTETE
ncbi:hypothetical protein JW859_14785 [bacterium]|nr:hypothetical protein [bacterium]